MNKFIKNEGFSLTKPRHFPNAVFSPTWTVRFLPLFLLYKGLYTRAGFFWETPDYLCVRC